MSEVLSKLANKIHMSYTDARNTIKDYLHNFIKKTLNSVNIIIDILSSIKTIKINKEMIMVIINYDDKAVFRRVIVNEIEYNYYHDCIVVITNKLEDDFCKNACCEKMSRGYRIFTITDNMKKLLKCSADDDKCIERFLENNIDASLGISCAIAQYLMLVLLFVFNADVIESAFRNYFNDKVYNVRILTDIINYKQQSIKSRIEALIEELKSD